MNNTNDNNVTYTPNQPQNFVRITDLPMEELLRVQEQLRKDIGELEIQKLFVLNTFTIFTKEIERRKTQPQPTPYQQPTP